MAGKTVADVVVERLRTWGVDRIFGYSGDGINGFMEAGRRDAAVADQRRLRRRIPDDDARRLL